ncbi:metal-sensitive transcriptional regulator [Deinococcus misasensis]|uniref:metal-sensitive transcriptional regulator n=1 Tax=Deinococcus misasensis TaxID=392413 RepID=UPI000551984C|nr:metal-sensitive transcriptional regulator [Deinococcus misasensis]
MTVVQDEQKKKILNRLNRLEGQIRGLHKMIDEERSCTEILTLLSGIKSALSATGDLVMEKYLTECQASGEGNPAEIVKVMKLLRG